jgi:hypothetical protein
MLRQSLIVTDKKVQNYVDAVRPFGLYIKQNRKCTYKRNIGVRLRNHYGSGKVISITYSDCMSVALGIQHAKRMCRIIVSFVALWFHHLFHIISYTTRNSETDVENTTCVLIFPATPVWKISHSKKNSGRYHKCTHYSCQILFSLYTTLYSMRMVSLPLKSRACF